jgi:multidrug efflux pump subunit AcrA (membrane-fusion protein)
MGPENHQPEPLEPTPGRHGDSTAESGKENRHDQHRPSRTALVAAAALVILLFATLLTLGVVSRVRRDRKNDAALKEDQQVATVTVIKAQRSSSSADLELPGNIQAMQVTTISARTSGYLKRWYVDIGDRVHTGQLLADIDAPEVRQEIEQARQNLNQAKAGLGQQQANLQQARTNAEFARVTYERYHYLVTQGVVSKQDADEKQAAYHVALATVDAQQANVRAADATINANQANLRRMIELQGYQRIYAPFTGVITARFVDTGALIGGSAGANPSTPTASAGGNGSAGAGAASGSGPGNDPSQTTSPSGSALFNIARIDTLRIYINVPQAFVSSMHKGETTDISVKEKPTEKFTGYVARTASALDPATRTLLTEVQIKNSDLTLLPGMYAAVKFSVALSEPPINVPSSALIVRADGTQVATVTADQKIHFQKVDVGRDYGKTVDIIGGLEENQEVVIDPTVSLGEGTPVRTTQGNQNQQQGEGQGNQGAGNQGAGGPNKAQKPAGLP